MTSNEMDALFELNIANNARYMAFSIFADFSRRFSPKPFHLFVSCNVSVLPTSRLRKFDISRCV